MTAHIEFQPDWASPPGETISDLLDERQLSLTDFSLLIGESEKQVRGLLYGKSCLTPTVAERLQQIFGAPANFWLAREAQYREDLARIEKSEGEELALEEWVKELPVGDMVKFGWIKSAANVTDKIRQCLNFFDVPDLATWHVDYEAQFKGIAFRTSRSFNAHFAAVAAWLRQGEVEGAKIVCADWDPQKFNSALAKIRPLSRHKSPAEFIPALQNLCAACGVAVVVVRAPKGCRASGATRFLNSNKALLMLSFRYLSDDHFWFSFFHEAGHLILHNTDLLFIEGGDGCDGSEEKEANQFAANALIPAQYQAELRALPPTYMAVMRFARKIGISPGIVVGQLQHLGLLKQTTLNQLKTRFKWE